MFIGFILTGNFSMLQDVRSVPNSILFWLHGFVQLSSRSALWYRWIRRFKSLRPQDIFYCEN